MHQDGVSPVEKIDGWGYNSHRIQPQTDKMSKMWMYLSHQGDGLIKAICYINESWEVFCKDGKCFRLQDVTQDGEVWLNNRWILHFTQKEDHWAIKNAHTNAEKVELEELVKSLEHRVTFSNPLSS